MREIAAEAGVATGAAYDYSEYKDAIVERLVKLAASPPMRPVRRMVAELMRTVTDRSSSTAPDTSS